MGCLQVEQPLTRKVGIRPAQMVKAIRLNHFPPFTPVSRAVNMRSVQTHDLVHAQRARTSPACLALSAEGSPVTSAGGSFMGLIFPHPSPCVPWLHRHYPASSLLRTLCLLCGRLFGSRASMNTLLSPAQVSLLHVFGLPSIPSPTTRPSLPSL